MEEKLNETAVWSRVTAASREAGNAQPETGPIGPELLAALERKQAAVGACRQLLSRCGGEGQKVLRRMLQQERQQAGTLAALYYFLTGQRPCLSPAGEQIRRESLADGLRRMMQTAELSAGRLEALAQRSTGEVQTALMALSGQERQLFHQLLSLLGQHMDR